VIAQCFSIIKTPHSNPASYLPKAGSLFSLRGFPRRTQRVIRLISHPKTNPILLVNWMVLSWEIESKDEANLANPGDAPEASER
jgi:hypothetical protein